MRAASVAYFDGTDQVYIGQVLVLLQLLSPPVRLSALVAPRTSNDTLIEQAERAMLP